MSYPHYYRRHNSSSRRPTSRHTQYYEPPPDYSDSSPEELSDIDYASNHRRFNHQNYLSNSGHRSPVVIRVSSSPTSSSSSLSSQVMSRQERINHMSNKIGQRSGQRERPFNEPVNEVSEVVVPSTKQTNHPMVPLMLPVKMAVLGPVSAKKNHRLYLPQRNPTFSAVDRSSGPPKVTPRVTPRSHLSSASFMTKSTSCLTNWKRSDYQAMNEQEDHRPQPELPKCPPRRSLSVKSVFCPNLSVNCQPSPSPQYNYGPGNQGAPHLRMTTCASSSSSSMNDMMKPLINEFRFYQKTHKNILGQKSELQKVIEKRQLRERTRAKDQVQLGSSGPDRQLEKILQLRQMKLSQSMVTTCDSSVTSSEEVQPVEDPTDTSTPPVVLRRFKRTTSTGGSLEKPNKISGIGTSSSSGNSSSSSILTSSINSSASSMSSSSVSSNSTTNNRLRHGSENDHQMINIRPILTTGGRYGLQVNQEGRQVGRRVSIGFGGKDEVEDINAHHHHRVDDRFGHDGFRNRHPPQPKTRLNK